MASQVAMVDTYHEDMIHDSQFDYYAKKLATCSSDRTIRIFEVSADGYHAAATISAHEGELHSSFILVAGCERRK